ncbi:MAG: extracellular solute-binding protein [Hyphomicrobium sp.]
MRLAALTLAAINSALAGAATARAEPRGSIALHGLPEVAAGFSHLPYTNPDAPKGGRVVLGYLGSFDSLNPMIVKGVPAAGVREFAVEALMARGLDEPFTLYGLIAETIDIAADNASVTFALNPKAQFSDSTPLTADDVLFSFELLKTKGRPNHRTYFSKVSKAEKLSPLAVRFTFEDTKDRELPFIMALMPVLSKAATNAETFEQTSLTPLVASGPYVVSRVDPGRSLSYTRNPAYWGKDLPVNRGRFNFGEIRVDYYREGSALFETFKSGGIDLRLEEDPSTWAGGYEFSAVREGKIVKQEFEIGLPAGMTGLAFNTRRGALKNPLVRRALVTLFDFEWVNRTLYGGLYKRTQSYFERSYLASTGKPADARERTLLKAYPGAVSGDILEGRFALPKTDGSGQNRESQKAAFESLKQAGYTLKDGLLIETTTGKPLTFEILAHNGVQQALLLSFTRNLEPLGIKASIRVVDSAQYQARLTSYDYDMIQTTWVSSLSPGNEQLFRWSSKSAGVPGTYNFAGVESPAADAMIEAMLAADTKEDFISAVRALDRVLLSGDYVIPLFHTPRQWVPHWTRLKHPDKTPVFGYALDTWWIEDLGEPK